MNQQKTLQAINIVKNFNQGKTTLEVLRGISQEFEQGKSYGLVGVSGSGKSTFMHILGGLDSPSQGDVLLFGNSLFKSSTRSSTLNKYLGFVFQFHYLVKELSVIENIMLPGLIAGISRSAAQKRAYELLDFLAMKHKALESPVVLSGGEQQRVSILRSMFNKPAFLIADEPTGNLDEENVQLALDLLLKGCKAWNMGLIVCSHDRYVYDRMDFVLRMQHGFLEQEK